jgi:SAM-dependent methyltransferase
MKELKTFSNFVHDKEHEYWKQIEEIEYYISLQLQAWKKSEVSMETVLDRFSIIDYESTHSEIYNENFMPKKIVDLGCGSGRFSCFVNMNLKDELLNTKFYLADFDRSLFDVNAKPDFEEIFDGGQGYKTNVDPEPYNDFEMMNLFSSYYGLKNCENINLDTDEITKLKEVDLVYSMASVGFHFSVEEAVKKYKINEILKPGGKLICQINYDNQSDWRSDMGNLILKSVESTDLEHLGRNVKGWYAVWVRK